MFFPGSETLAPAPHDDTGTETAALVLSHLLILVAVPVLLLRRIFYPAAAALAVLINSDIYHLARSTGTAFGIGVDNARYLDYIAATHAPVALALTALLLDRGGGAAGVLARTLAPFVVAYGVMAYPMQPQSFVVALAFVIVVMAWMLLVQSELRERESPTGGYINWGWMALAFMCLFPGVILFYIPSASYPVAHSLWHVFIGAALMCMARAVYENRTHSGVV